MDLLQKEKSTLGPYSRSVKPLQFRAATVAVAVAVACEVVVAVGSAFDFPRRWRRVHPAQRGAIIGVAFSCLLLLLDFPHLRRVSKGIDKAVEQGTRDFYHIGWFLRYP